MKKFDCSREGCTFFSVVRHGLDIHLSLSNTNGFHERKHIKGLKLSYAEQRFQDA